MSRAKHARDAVMECVPVQQTTPVSEALDDYRLALREQFYADALDAVAQIEFASEDGLTPESRILLAWIKTALDSLVD